MSGEDKVAVGGAADLETATRLMLTQRRKRLSYVKLLKASDGRIWKAGLPNRRRGGEGGAQGAPGEVGMAVRPQTRRARQLRRNASEAERILWRALHGIPMSHKIRRQHPIGRYVADFAFARPPPAIGTAARSA